MISSGEDVVDKEKEGSEEAREEDVPESDVDGVVWFVVDFHDLKFSLIDGEDRPGGVHDEEDDEDGEELEFPGKTDGCKDRSEGDDDGGLYFYEGGDVFFGDGFHE